jgi:hypothetical protein
MTSSGAPSLEPFNLGERLGELLVPVGELLLPVGEPLLPVGELARELVGDPSRGTTAVAL